MSHFTVMVIGEDPEEQLRPFNEQPEGADAEELLELDDHTDEAREEYETGTTEVVNVGTQEKPKYIHAHEYDGDQNSHTWKGGVQVKIEPKYPAGLTEENLPYKQFYKSFAVFCRKYHGYREKDGRWGYMRNTDITGPNGGLIKGAKWDWYSLGGRWTGHMKLKPGAEGIQGRPGLMTAPGQKGWVDQCRKGDIDIDGMMNDTYKAALQAYGEGVGEIKKESEKYAAKLEHDLYYEACVVVRPREGEPFNKAIYLGDVIRTRPEDKTELRNPAPTREEAELVVEAHLREHPKSETVIVERTKKDLIEEHDFTMAYWKHGIHRDEYTGNFDKDAEKHARRIQNGVLSTFAVLKDGEWFERGSMGWWGMVADEKDCEEWQRQWWEMFEALPDDTLLSVYDCHI